MEKKFEKSLPEVLDNFHSCTLNLICDKGQVDENQANQATPTSIGKKGDGRVGNFQWGVDHKDSWNGLKGVDQKHAKTDWPLQKLIVFQLILVHVQETMGRLKLCPMHFFNVLLEDGDTATKKCHVAVHKHLSQEDENWLRYKETLPKLV